MSRKHTSIIDNTWFYPQTILLQTITSSYYGGDHNNYCKIVKDEIEIAASHNKSEFVAGNVRICSRSMSGFVAGECLDL